MARSHHHGTRHNLIDARVLVFLIMLDMQMSAQVQAHAMIRQHPHQFLVVLDRTVVIKGPAHSALIQQVMMADGYHAGAFPLRLIQNRLHPLIRFPADHAADLIFRFILTGIQHQHPVCTVYLIKITQRCRIPAVRRYIAKISINIPELIRCDGLHLFRSIRRIAAGIRVIDIVVSWYNRDLNSRLTESFQKFCQFLMAHFLPVQRQIAAQNQKIWIFLLHIIEKSVHDLPAVLQHAPVSAPRHSDKGITAVSCQFLGKIVHIRCHHDLLFHEMVLGFLFPAFFVFGSLMALLCLLCLSCLSLRLLCGTRTFRFRLAGNLRRVCLLR